MPSSEGSRCVGFDIFERILLSRDCGNWEFLSLDRGDILLVVLDVRCIAGQYFGGGVVVVDGLGRR